MGVLPSAECLGVSATGVSLETLPVLAAGVIGVIASLVGESFFTGVSVTVLDGSTNLGAANFKKSIINGIIVVMFALRDFGNNWNIKVAVKVPSVNIRRDCLAGTDGMLSFASPDDILICLVKSKVFSNEPPLFLFASLKQSQTKSKNT
jgi:hypothetical protein